MRNTLEFCTEPDKNGNFLLLDVNVETKEYQYGYHFRYANRADDIVLARKQMSKLVDRLVSAGFKRVN